MKTNTSLVAKNVSLQQWVQEIHECNSRPKGMSVDEWCNERGLKKNSYYWHLRKVREACLDISHIDVGNSSMSEVNTQLIEIKPKPVFHTESKAVIRIGNSSIEINDDTSVELIARIIKVVAHAE